MSQDVISRRQLLVRGGLALAAMSLAAACAPIAPRTLAGPTAAGAASAPAPAKKGGTLVFGQLTPILNTTPCPGVPANGTFRWAMFDPLVSLDDHKQPVPSLAESWSFSDDRLTLTFKLRQGVTFHSGRPFTADEAKWNIEYALDPKTGAQPGAGLKGVQARAVDAGTLELKLPDVLPQVFSLLADVLMIDPQSDITLNAAGTGPFKFDSLTPGDEMRLVRNPRYWRADRPYLDALTCRTLPDASSAVVNLESGAISVCSCRASDVQRLSTGANTATVVVPANGSYDLLISTVDPPFTDKRVRQAIDLSLDRKRFAEKVLFGLTEPTYIMWPKTSPAWDAALDVGEFNLDKARQLLADAGYPNGFETKIQASRNYPESVQFDEIIQADLAKIGVSASIELLEPNEASALHAQGKFSPMLSLQSGNGDRDPAMLFTAFPFRTSGNTTRFQSDQYTQQVDAARREPDFEKRLGLYRQIARFVKDEAFALPIANYVVPYAMRSNVRGFARQPTSPSAGLEDVWLA